MPYSSCVCTEASGAGRYESVVVRPLLEGFYLSDPERTSQQMDADSLCSGFSQGSSKQHSREVRACREPCAAQQGAWLNVFSRDASA